jgi:hypothetical protein
LKTKNLIEQFINFTIGNLVAVIKNNLTAFAVGNLAIKQ